MAKLGGSAITRKDSVNEYLPGAGIAISELSRARLVLVHGGGSFAHPHIAMYGLSNRGVALAKAGLRKLTAMIIEEAEKYGAYLYPIDASILIIDPNNARKVILELVDHGYIPITSGDVVAYNGSIRIVSGDELMVLLAQMLKPDYALFLTNVDGVYLGGTRLVEVPCDVEVKGASGIDVTGGISAKLAAAREIAGLGVKTYVCSIHDRDALRGFAANKPVEGRCSLVLPC